jgi:hypothetical protein
MLHAGLEENGEIAATMTRRPSALTARPARRSSRSAWSAAGDATVSTSGLSASNASARSAVRRSMISVRFGPASTWQ